MQQGKLAESPAVGVAVDLSDERPQNRDGGEERGKRATGGGWVRRQGEEVKSVGHRLEGRQVNGPARQETSRIVDHREGDAKRGAAGASVGWWGIAVVAAVCAGWREAGRSVFPGQEARGELTTRRP